MKVLQTNEFERSVKKLPKQLKSDLDVAVKAVMANPEVGELKKADLSGVRVYKFKMNKQLTLLAYSYEEDTVTLHLLKLGSHENFYRDLKNTTRALLVTDLSEGIGQAPVPDDPAGVLSVAWSGNTP